MKGRDCELGMDHTISRHDLLNGMGIALSGSMLFPWAPGCIWGGANYMPRESVQLFERVASGDIAGAMELWSRMISSLLYIWRSNYIPEVKAASRMRGFDGGGVRAPLQDLSTGEERELAACLAPLGE